MSLMQDVLQECAQLDLKEMRRILPKKNRPAEALYQLDEHGFRCAYLLQTYEVTLLQIYEGANKAFDSGFGTQEIETEYGAHLQDINTRIMLLRAEIAHALFQVAPQETGYRMDFQFTLFSCGHIEVLFEEASDEDAVSLEPVFANL